MTKLRVSVHTFFVIATISTASTALCEVGSQVACTCSIGTSGNRTCSGNSYGACVCPPPSLVVSGYPTAPQAGTASSFTVEAVDASSGGRISGFRGGVVFSTDNTGASIPATYTFTSADAGIHTFLATMNTAAVSSALTASPSAYRTSTAGSQTGIVVTPAAFELSATGGRHSHWSANDGHRRARVRLGCACEEWRRYDGQRLHRLCNSNECWIRSQCRRWRKSDCGCAKRSGNVQSVPSDSWCGDHHCFGVICYRVAVYIRLSRVRTEPFIRL